MASSIIYRSGASRDTRSTMNAVRKQVARARRAVATGMITREELARRAGISPSTTRGMLADTWNPTAATLIALTEALDAMNFEAGEGRCCHTPVESVD